MLLGIICNKPVHDTERYICGSVDYGEHFLHIFTAVFMVETEDFMKEEIILCIVDTDSMGERLYVSEYIFGRMLKSQHYFICA
jgi:hypothetical protein